MGILEGKVAIITGAGHGVGRGHALDMAEQGAKVVVNDLGGSGQGEGADQRPAEEVAELIRSRGGEAVANYSDVSDMKAAGEMVQQAVDTFGGLDILVNNAGILRDKMIFSMEESDWDAIMKVHLKGHFAPAHHACVYWREKFKQTDRPCNASVINTSSLVGLVGNVGQTNYAAAKGGIAMFTIALSVDMERYGVRSNCIAPSGNTRLIALTRARGSEAERVKEPEEYTEYDPSNPGNVAPLAVYLASDLSAHVNGQVFLSRGSTVSHWAPWTETGQVTVPGNDKKWDPAELGRALDEKIFHTKHGGLRGYMGRQMG